MICNAQKLLVSLNYVDVLLDFRDELLKIENL